MKQINQKKIFSLIFTLFVLILMFLPFVLFFNDLITGWFERFSLYQSLQKFIVPFQAKIVGVILIAFGFDYVAYLDGMKVNGVSIGISWNCLGWQSLVLFFITIIPGLKGNFTIISKIDAFLIGILSLFLVNIFRITFATILAVLYRPLFMIVFHDYLAAGITVTWLFFFWWFSYKYVLEERIING